MYKAHKAHLKDHMDTINPLEKLKLGNDKNHMDKNFWWSNIKHFLKKFPITGLFLI
jgi:hypothetical protein